MLLAFSQRLNVCFVKDLWPNGVSCFKGELSSQLWPRPWSHFGAVIPEWFSLCWASGVAGGWQVAALQRFPQNPDLLASLGLQDACLVNTLW